MQTTSRRKLLKRDWWRNTCPALAREPCQNPATGETSQTSCLVLCSNRCSAAWFLPSESEAAIPKFTGSRTEVVTDAELSVGLHDWQLTPTQEPLQRVKDKLTFITGLDRTFQEGTDVHAQCASCFLTSAAPHTVTQSPYPQARTFDRVIAETLGKHTPFRTLEFSCNSHKDNKESIQFDNISWYGTEHVAQHA